MMRPIRALVLTGSMGAGKTTVLAEMSDVLVDRGTVHAAIDVDALGTIHLPEPTRTAVERKNLRAVCENCLDAGVRDFLIAEALESTAELDQLRTAVPTSHIVVCRLRANLVTMQQRVQERERGFRQQEFVARVAALEATLEAAALEDFSVSNDGPVADVAVQVLTRAGWI